MEQNGPALKARLNIDVFFLLPLAAADFLAPSALDPYLPDSQGFALGYDETPLRGSIRWIWHITIETCFL
jgi:hypothetical protein